MNLSEIMHPDNTQAKVLKDVWKRDVEDRISFTKEQLKNGYSISKVPTAASYADHVV